MWEDPTLPQLVFLFCEPARAKRAPVKAFFCCWFAPDLVLSPQARGYEPADFVTGLVCLNRSLPRLADCDPKRKFRILFGSDYIVP